MKTLMIIAAMAFSTIAIGQTNKAQEWVESKYDIRTAMIEEEGDSIIITEREAIPTPRESFQLVIVIKDTSISFYDSKRHLPYKSSITAEIEEDFQTFINTK